MVTVIMGYAERIHLRRELLGDLYLQYFTSGGVNTDITELYKSGKENRLAYTYLEDVGYLTYKAKLTKERKIELVTASITARGINAVEQEGIKLQKQALDQFEEGETVVGGSK